MQRLHTQTPEPGCRSAPQLSRCVTLARFPPSLCPLLLSLLANAAARGQEPARTQHTATDLRVTHKSGETESRLKRKELMTRGGHRGWLLCGGGRCSGLSCPSEPTNAGLFIVSVAHEAPRCLGPKLPTRFCPTNLLLRSRLPHPGPATPGPPRRLSPTSWRCGWLPHAHSLHPWGPSKMCPSPTTSEACPGPSPAWPIAVSVAGASTLAPASLCTLGPATLSQGASWCCPPQGLPHHACKETPNPYSPEPQSLRARAPLTPVCPPWWHSPALATQASSWFLRACAPAFPPHVLLHKCPRQRCPLQVSAQMSPPRAYPGPTCSPALSDSTPWPPLHPFPSYFFKVCIST